MTNEGWSPEMERTLGIDTKFRRIILNTLEITSCQSCGVKTGGLHLHHTKYTSNMTIWDLKVFCGKCHRIEHKRITALKKEARKKGLVPPSLKREISKRCPVCNSSRFRAVFPKPKNTKIYFKCLKCDYELKREYKQNNRVLREPAKTIGVSQ